MDSKIIEAAKLIAYDNGAINRFSSEEDVVTRMIKAADNNFNAGELECVENFLDHLSEEDLVELCTGERTVLSTELVCVVLETMFDNM